MVKCNRSADHFLMILCSLFALLLLHFCFGFCGAFVLRLCHSEKPHRCPHFVPILSYPQELKRLIRKGETALLIVCHCEHTEKTLFFVPVLYRFCAYFLPLFFLPLRADEKQATERNVDFLAPFWHRFGFSSFIPGVALWFAPAHVPRHYGRHREEGRFLSWF